MPPTFMSQRENARYAYRHAPVDWRMDVCRETRAVNERGDVYNWQLFHYLAGGGIGAFGRTLKQDISSRRQNRFLAISGVLAALWAILWII